MNVHFRLGDRDSADWLVKQYHYSRRIPSNVQLCATWHTDGGLFGDSGPAIAAVFFSLPPTRWSEEVWELSRLVRHEGECPPLTGLIGKAVKWCGRKGAHLLVSFADSTQAHHGGIYQAASWNFAGKRDRRMDGLIVGGAFVPGRSANSLWGTRSPSRLKERKGIEAEPHYDEGKYLYWKAVTKEGKARAARLGLEALPYPKPTAETLTCSSELVVGCGPAWYPVRADIEPFWSLSMASPTVQSGPPAPPVRCQLSTMEGGPF